MPDTAEPGGRVESSPLGPVAQALHTRMTQRYFMTEHYGPDGEILEAWEGHPIEDDLPEGAVAAVIVSGHGYAAPRMDWRKRGILPPRGFHRSRWR